MQVTKNEKILLRFLFAVAFCVGNFFGYRWLAQKQQRLDLSLATMKADQAEAKIDLQESDLWTQRKSWINSRNRSSGEGAGSGVST